MHWQVVSESNIVNFSWYLSMYKLYEYKYYMQNRYSLLLCIEYIFNTRTTQQGRIQELVQGGLHFFFFPGEGSSPVGAWKPPEFNRFHWSRGGLAPVVTPQSLKHIKCINIWKMCKQTGWLKNAILYTTALTIVRWQRKMENFRLS